MTKPLPPARLFVLLARQASIGVILRRGPSDWVQMIKWHTDTDKFEEGQWFHGKVNGPNSDLSPHGEFIICLMTSYKRNKDPEYWNSWTALSKPPYFTALITWPQWGGGGRFIDNRSVHVGGNSPMQPADAIKHIQFVDEPSPYQDIWEQKGWQQTQLDGKDAHKKQRVNLAVYVSNYRIDSKRGWVWDFGISVGQMHQQLDGLDWANFDQQGRLVLAKEGKLFSATVENNSLQLTKLADFNGNKFEPIEAPDWAQKW